MFNNNYCVPLGLLLMKLNEIGGEQIIAEDR